MSELFKHILEYSSQPFLEVQIADNFVWVTPNNFYLGKTAQYKQRHLIELRMNRRTHYAIDNTKMKII